jgi:hypothetical protein
MADHFWGDGWPYFGDVGDAAYEVGKFCRRWGRISVTQTKEKYGTARVYCRFGCEDLHGLFYPGYCFVQLPRWLSKLVGKKVAYWIMTFPILQPFGNIICRYQHKVYRRAYKLAIRKFPHIREEILDCADFGEYLVGL